MLEVIIVFNEHQIIFQLKGKKLRKLLILNIRSNTRLNYCNKMAYFFHCKFKYSLTREDIYNLEKYFTCEMPSRF